jgi:tetratricopeptide (TPR) repeat protein
VNYYIRRSGSLVDLGREIGIDAAYPDINNIAYSAIFPLLLSNDNDNLRTFLQSKQCFLLSQFETGIFDEFGNAFEDDWDIDNFIVLHNHIGKQAAARGDWDLASAALFPAMQEMFKVGRAIWPQETLNFHMRDNAECLAPVLMALSDYANASSLYRALVVISEQDNDPQSKVLHLIGGALSMLHEGDDEDAREQCVAALELTISLDDLFLQAKALRALGIIDRERGDRSAARAAIEASARMLESTFEQCIDLALSLQLLSRIEADEGNANASDLLSSRAATMLREVRSPIERSSWFRQWEIDIAFGTV